MATMGNRYIVRTITGYSIGTGSQRRTDCHYVADAWNGFRVVAIARSPRYAGRHFPTAKRRARMEAVALGLNREHEAWLNG